MIIPYKIAITFLLIALILYLLVVSYIFVTQRSRIYLTSTTDFHACKTDAQKIEHNGTRMLLIERTHNFLVFYHGNADTACNNLKLDEYAKKANYSLLLVEYNGYAMKGGKPTEAKLQQDVKNAIAFLDKQKANRIVVMGGSFGGAPAAYHSSLAKADTLILMSTFDELSTIGQLQYPYLPVRLLLLDKFPTKDYIKDRKGRTLFIHGTNDSVIPYRIAERMYESLGGDKEMVAVDSGTHDDVLDYPRVKDAILKELK